MKTRWRAMWGLWRSCWRGIYRQERAGPGAWDWRWIALISCIEVFCGTWSVTSLLLNLNLEMLIPLSHSASLWSIPSRIVQCCIMASVFTAIASRVSSPSFPSALLLYSQSIDHRSNISLIGIDRIHPKPSYLYCSYMESASGCIHIPTFSAT